MNTIFRRTAAIFLLVLATGVQAQVRDGQGLTIERGQSAQRRGPEILHPLRVDQRRFEATGRGQSIDLPGVGGATQRARFERSVRRGGDYTWIGKVDTQFGPQPVIITFGERAVFGTIPQRRGPPLRVESQRGRHYLVEGEQRRMMRAGGKDDARIPPRVSGSRDTTPVSGSATTTPVQPASDAPTVDVLALYTPSMVTRLGSVSAVLTRLSYLEAVANQAYADTPADIQIRIVGREELNYTAATQNNTLLDLITNPSSDAIKVQVDAWRNQYGADLVAVVRAFEASTQDDCGVGWIGGYHGSSFSANYGFSVSGDGSSDGYYCIDTTFAHEVGHNMGSHHDVDTAGGDYGAFSYSHGYRATPAGTDGFATVMAYSEGSQQNLVRFSNPDVSVCNGVACGTATADNAMALSQAAPLLAAFRATVVPPTPTISVADVSVSEGNSGTKTLTFRVQLSAAAGTTVHFTAATANGTATAGSDYSSYGPVSLNIAGGATYRDVSVTINGDTAVEGNETFTFNVTSPIGATIADGTATGTITNDDAAAPPSLTVGNATVTEGNSGTKTAVFTVSLSKVWTSPVTFNFATQAGGTATAGTDYVARTLNGMQFAPGVTSRTIAVTINGDTTIEANETFVVAVTGVVGATVADGSGLGTITNDDLPKMSIGDVSISEGNAGTKLAVFTVLLDRTSPYTVTFSMATTGAGTATAGVDYVARTLNGMQFAPGVTSRTVAITINGDTTVENNETFVVGLSGVTNATVADGAALGVITNDD
jgi:hypothetical protein